MVCQAVARGVEEWLIHRRRRAASGCFRLRSIGGFASSTRKVTRVGSAPGPDPTVAEIDEVENLERMAAKLAMEMDNFVSNRMG